MFFAKKEYSLQQLAELTNSKLVGDPSLLISGVNDLESAEASDVSFLANQLYEKKMLSSKAGCICTSNKVELHPGKNFLISENPSNTFQQILKLFHDQSLTQTAFNGLHKSAVIHESAELGENVHIGPNVVIDRNVKIGKNTRIYPNTFIGAGVFIGEDCLIYSNVTLREGSELHNRVIIQPGAVIGSCGFGYLPDASGNYKKLDQFGHVIIEDDVEIGANTAIDRARFKYTIIKKGTKIDNLVQIAHNVEIGQNNIIISQVGIAGSTKTGKNVILAGQVGVVGHLTIADNVMVAAKSGVGKSITEPGKYSGRPVAPIDEYNRRSVHLKRITEYAEDIKSLKKQVQELKDKLQGAPT